MAISKEDLKAYFQKIGAQGGKAAGQRMTKTERRERARKGAAARWGSNKKGGKQ